MRSCLVALFLLGVTFAGHGSDDERQLTKSIQQDLRALGYEVDNLDGTLSMQTRIAIGAAEERYQMAVTGNPSFDLAVKMQADTHAQKQGLSTGTADAGTPLQETETANPPAPNAECLQKQVNENRKKRTSTIASAGSRLLQRFGNEDVIDSLDEVTQDAAAIIDTSDDVKTIAQELGLTEDEVRKCM